MSRPNRKPAIHKFSFEIWPPNPDGASYPIRLPDSVSAWAPDIETALKIAARDVPDGWTIGYRYHHRGVCEPAHPGMQ